MVAGRAVVGVVVRVVRVVLVVVQLLVFVLIDKLLGGLPQRAREGEMGAAAVLAAARVGSALILAAAVAG